MPSKKVDSDGNGKQNVEIARIGYRQAVVVSTITAISTFAVTLVGSYFAFPSSQSSVEPTPPSQRFITIDAISVIDVGDRTTEEFRVNVSVNGYRYGFPTRTVWADPENLSLPLTWPITHDDEYQVEFSADRMVRLPDGSVVDEDRTHPQPRDIIDFTGGQELRTYAAIDWLTIRYSVHE